MTIREGREGSNLQNKTIREGREGSNEQVRQ